MNKTYHFLAGLPRSGSTVLGAILNQNPSIYVTPTSPMLPVTVAMQEAWQTDPSVKANQIEQQIQNLTTALLDAFWMHRPESIIIDKNRGWAKNMLVATKLFGHSVKAICVERDLPSIMASWLTLLRKNPGNSAEQNVKLRGLDPTDNNLMAEMWFNMVKDCMDCVQQLKRLAPNQFIIVKYDDLITNPNNELNKIEEFLNLPKYTYQFSNIVNDTVDDDLLAWGLDGLHTIRSTLKKTSADSFKILGAELYHRFLMIDQAYQIN